MSKSLTQEVLARYNSDGEFVTLMNLEGVAIPPASNVVTLATDSSGNVTGLVGPGGMEVDYLAAIGGRVASVTYSPSGQIVAYSSGGVSYTVSYDANGRVQSVTDGTTVRTVTYNANGTVASII